MKILTAARAAALAVKAVYSTTTVTLSAWWQGLSASWGGVSYEALARRAYRNPTAARALRLISQLQSAAPFVVELPGGEMVTDHEMLRIVDRPNPRTSRSLLFDKITAHLYCGGEVFFHRTAPESGPNAGRPTAKGASLALLNPGRFEDFARDGAGEVTGYWFGTGDARRTLYPAQDVLHVRIYNPTDEDRGMPLLLAADRALQQVEATDDWNRSIASAGGRSPGYFTPKGEGQMTPEQVAAAQESADKATLERNARHLPQVMSGAFEYKSASMTLRDADFLKGTQENARRIAAVVGIPATLLGDEKAGSLTDAGVNSEVRAAYLLTVLPLLDYVLGELNAWLSPAYGGARLAYDRDQIEALSPDVNALYQRMALAVGGPFLTVNEARESQNYAPLAGGVYDEVRRVAEQERGGRVVRDGDGDGDAGEGQAEAPAAMRAVRMNGTDDLGGFRAAIRARVHRLQLVEN